MIYQLIIVDLDRCKSTLNSILQPLQKRIFSAGRNKVFADYRPKLYTIDINVTDIILTVLTL